MTIYRLLNKTSERMHAVAVQRVNGQYHLVTELLLVPPYAPVATRRFMYQFRQRPHVKQRASLHVLVR